MATRRVKTQGLIEMFREGKDVLADIELKKERKIMATEEKKVMIETIVRKAGKLPYEFIQQRVEGTFQDGVELKAMADDAFSETVSSPPAPVAVQAPVATPTPATVPVGDTLDPFALPSEDPFNGKCKYCQSDMWDNTEKNPSFDYKFGFKPKWSCKDKVCGQAYFPENEPAKRWYKKP